MRERQIQTETEGETETERQIETERDRERQRERGELCNGQSAGDLGWMHSVGMATMQTTLALVLQMAINTASKLQYIIQTVDCLFHLA